MTEIFTIILTIIAPIIVVATLGGWLDRLRALEVRSLSRVVIYLTSPALAFYSMANATIQTDELVDLFVFSLGTALASTLLAWAISRLFKMTKLTASAFVLSIGLTNIGNYGIPFNEFAFGQPGLERALVITVIMALYANTAGVFIASWGRASVWRALGNVLRVPTPYAAVLGLMVNFWHLPVPTLLMRVAGLLEGAAIPLMLLLLGIQISRVSFVGTQWAVIFGATGVRLIGGPLLGWLAAWLLGLQGVTMQVAIVEAAMPTAVISTILATEFESNAQLTSSIVLVSTLLSIISLSVLLYLLL